MSEKSFNLISGTEGDWGWTVQCRIFSTGRLHKRGTIQYYNQKRSSHKYYKTHKDESKKRTKRWCKENLERRRLALRAWRINHPERTKELRRKNSYKRRRNLGCEPLNKFFSGSEAHHIDRKHVIHMPKKLHKSISHNVFTGKNMVNINLIAWNFLKQQHEEIS